MSRIKVTAVSANAGHPSRTLSLTQRILASVGELVSIEPQLIELSRVGPLIGQSSNRHDLPADAEHALTLVESADLLIAVTPVYRGSYTGLFKHLFDLVDQNALIDVPVILAATGGSDRHCLVLEHQLRPLFGFFRAYTVPIPIYATDKDFRDGQVSSRPVLERIAIAARQAAALARPRVRDAATGAAQALTASI